MSDAVSEATGTTEVKIVWSPETLARREEAIAILTTHPISLLAVVDDGPSVWGNLRAYLMADDHRFHTLTRQDAQELVDEFLAERMAEAGEIWPMLVSLRGKEIEPFSENVPGGGPLCCSVAGGIVRFQDTSGPYYIFNLNELTYAVYPSESQINSTERLNRGSLTVANDLLRLQPTIETLVRDVRRWL